MRLLAGSMLQRSQVFDHLSCSVTGYRAARRLAGTNITSQIDPASILTLTCPDGSSGQLFLGARSRLVGWRQAPPVPSALQAPCDAARRSAHANRDPAGMHGLQCDLYKSRNNAAVECTSPVGIHLALHARSSAASHLWCLGRLNQERHARRHRVWRKGAVHLRIEHERDGAPSFGSSVQ